jgi:hypothetical protein
MSREKKKRGKHWGDFLKNKAKKSKKKTSEEIPKGIETHSRGT